MKNIDIEELKKLMVIIKEAPSIRIGHFSDNGLELANILETFCKEKEYEYILYAIDKDYADNVEKYIKNTKFFKLDRPKYMLNGKFFDYVFVTANIEDKESFVKKVHPVIKNAGEIIIFVKNRDYINIDNWKRLLEENYYVATNLIEIDSNYSVIVSKKMHGWGG